MEKLNEFVNLLVGKFDNKEQFGQMKNDGKDYPYCEHVNSICNSKIINLPEKFEGIFMLEESYYTLNDRTNSMPHLFLFTLEGENIKLTSYEMPDGYTKEDFKYENLKEIDFLKLNESKKFVPAIYKENLGSWEGGSVSMFSPVLKFTLFERFSEEKLEVTEKMEINGKRTFGYDDPILYKRV